jgi:hypothetical protein
MFEPFKTLLAKHLCRLRFVGLTLKYRQDVLLKERVIRIRRSFKILLKKYRRELRGGLYSIEAKRTDEGGWNVHIHILCEGSYIPQAELSQAWLKITGDSPVVDIRAVYSRVEGLKYLLKYLLKAPDVKGCADEYNEAFRGVRMVSAFGNWYNQARILEKEADNSPLVCPCCGGKEWLTEFDLAHELKWWRSSS